VKSNSYRRGFNRSILFALATATCIADPMIAKDVDIAGLVRQAKPVVVQIVTLDKQNKPLKAGTVFFLFPQTAIC
jgi:hypothetical protein